MMFSTFATATTGSTGGGMTQTILMMVVMVAIFYFLLIRPENKRKKQAEEMRSSLKKGDWLTTIGVYGRVVAITDRTVVIETSEDRVRVEFLKSAIGSVGTLDEQAAAQQRPARAGKKAAKESDVEVPGDKVEHEEEPSSEE